MAEPAGTETIEEAKKRTKNTPTPPRCANDKQKRAPEEGESAISTLKMPGKTRKRRKTHQSTLSRTPRPS